MTERKKYAIIVATLVIALIVSFTTMLIVLVASNQSATSQVNIKYTAEDVAVKLSASATIGAVTTNFTTKEDGTGETEISLSPTNETGALYQPNSNKTSLNLTKENDEVMFKYAFTNKSGDVNVKLTMTTLPEIAKNLTFSYAHTRDGGVDPMTLTRTTAIPQDVSWLLAGYAGEEPSTYVYIFAKVRDLLQGADLMGSFAWNMERTTEEEVTTYTLNTTGADLIERTTTTLSTTDTANMTSMSYTTWADETPTSIDVIPAKTNNAFIGWANADAPDTVVVSANPSIDNGLETNAIRGTVSTNLVPVYKLGTVPDSSIEWDSTTSSYKILATTISTDVTEFVFPDIYKKGTNPIAKVTTMEDGYDDFESMETVGLLVNNNTITNIWLGRFLTNLGGYAFYGCTGLENIEIPNSVTSIGEGAFGSCKSLTIITISNSVTSIGEGAFNSCSGLTNITIPNSVTSIGGLAFSGSGITSLTIPNSVTSIGGMAFYYCNSLISITISNSVTNIESYTFSYCSSLTNITIPNSVISIGTEAFSYCSSLTSVTIGNSVTKIGFMAFSGCSNLTSATFEGATATTVWTVGTIVLGVADPAINASNLKTHAGGTWTRTAV